MAQKTNAYYRGPVSDHFDGERFFLPGHYTSNCKSDFWKWRMSGKRKPWPKRVANPPPATLQPRLHAHDLAVTFIGHATVLIQTAGLNILTDPHFSKRASPLPFAGPRRVRDPGIHFEDLPHVDVVLLSHSHYDHMDFPTLRKLHDRFGPRIITPLGNAAILSRARRHFAVQEADWGDSIKLGSDTSVTLAPALHWSKRTLHDRNMALWGAFVLQAPGGPVYFAGDTGYGSGDHFRDIREEFGAPRLALLPIGAYEPRWFMRTSHMNPAEAVLAHQDLGARQSLAIHHGTIQLTDEAIDDPPRDLGIALSDARIDTTDFRVLEPGLDWRLPDPVTKPQGMLEPAAE